MSESRIVVETTCPHGQTRGHGAVMPGGGVYCPGGGSRIIDPGNLPAEVIEAAARAVEQYGVYDHSESVGRAALSAAFRTL